jgi:DNA ligase-1
MSICQLLESIADSRGSNEKKRLLAEHSNNLVLKKILRYALDPYITFNVVKVPAVKKRYTLKDEAARWDVFFEAADLCASRAYTGNIAINLLHVALSAASAEEERWMRKILKKRLGIGASTKTINNVYKSLIPTFDVSLAQKFEEKRIVGKRIAVEPKLDGIRCFAIVKNGEALLYARSGKLIKNFDSTIGKELSNLGDGCYDGEIMGEDFIALMRQAYRKENVDTEGTYLSLFDYLPIREWTTREVRLSCEERYAILVRRIYGMSAQDVTQTILVGQNHLRAPKYLRVVKRQHVKSDYEEIKKLHDKFVAERFEGAMIKDLDATYRFGRGYEVMKLKAALDLDLEVVRVEEGTGKYIGTAGAIIVNFNGVEVGVGSGLTDKTRSQIWLNKDNFIGRIAEIQFQEITPDGSLRFPRFICWRNDRSCAEKG